MQIAKVPLDDRCRDRIGELMAEDDGQRRGERVASRAVPEIEVPRPEAGEEMDVSEPTTRVGMYHRPDQLPRIKSGPLGSGSRVNEMNTDERDSKRVEFAEGRGQRRKGEDVEELEANAEEQGACPQNLEDRRCRRGYGSRSARTDVDGGTVHEQICIQQDRSVRED